NRWAPIMQKVKCMFDATSGASAIARVCGRADAAHNVVADCGDGIVTIGHSQGGFLAIMANNFDARVRAAVGLSDTDKADVLTYHLDYANCLDDVGKNPTSLRMLDSSRLLLLHGANDTLATLGPSPGALDFIQAVAGSPASCGASCLSANGSGYYIVQPADLTPPSQQGSQDGHCWMYDSATDCGPTYTSVSAGFDAQWSSGTGTASAYSVATFLGQFV